MVKDALEALELCVVCLNEILDFPMTTKLKEDIFPAESIENIRNIANAALYSRKKRNFGVIGGSLAGILGGGLSIAGAALIPFTFGASIGLLISGGVIALAGAGTSIGFSVEKIIGDKDKLKEFKPNLEMFIDFNKKVAHATVTIHQLLKFIDKNQIPKLSLKELHPDEVIHIKNIENETRLLYESEKNVLEFYEKLKLIDKCVKNIHEEIGELMKHWLKVQEMKQFPETEEQKEARREEEKGKQSKMQSEEQKLKESFDLLVEAIPEPPIDESEMTFRVFVRRYLGINANVDNHSTGIGVPIGEIGTAGAKFAVGGAGIGVRVAATAADAADDLAKVGATVARIAQGVSAASIVLGALGIVVDLAFLGHAVYDLYKLSNIADNRSAAKKCESNELSEKLLDLVDLMDTINTICNVA